MDRLTLPIDLIPITVSISSKKHLTSIEEAGLLLRRRRKLAKDASRSFNFSDPQPSLSGDSNLCSSQVET